MMLYEFDIWTERKGKQTYTQRWPPPAPNYRHRQAFHGQRRFPHLAAGRLNKIWGVYIQDQQKIGLCRMVYLEV